jgi:hypothetical protein
MNKGLFWGVVLTFLCLVFVSLIPEVESEESSSSSSLPKLNEILKDYDLRKQKAYREKFCRNQDLVIRHERYRKKGIKFMTISSNI